jgi:hypothetical protein
MAFIKLGNSIVIKRFEGGTLEEGSMRYNRRAGVHDTIACNPEWIKNGLFELKRHVDNARTTSCREMEPTLLECLQHGGILRQHLGYELLDP